MEESILRTIKKMLNVDPNNTDFDIDIIIDINTVFMVLKQLGVGPEFENFSISDDTAKWSDFLENRNDLDSVKTYMYLKVKMVFDPPVNSSIIESYNKLINEYEWRLNSQIDYNVDE